MTSDAAPVLDEAAIRRDERQRCADLLTKHRETLATFPASSWQTVDLIALLLRLPLYTAPAPASPQAPQPGDGR